MRHSALAAGLILSLTGCMVQPPGTPTSPALNEAMQRFPPMILGANVTAVADPETAIPPSCPKAGSRVEQKGGPTILFLGIVNGNPDLCHMKLGDDTLDAWFGIWGTTWPGAADAYPAIRRAYHSRTGEIVGFDTIAQTGAQPGVQWHDLIRNDGVEEIPLLGKTYRAVKLAHYREGFGGNRYRSVATLWVDLNTGLPVYATYQHIAGQPELDSPLIPTAIVPAP